MRYSCNDIFMVRTPSLPASVFSDFVQFEGNDVENFLQQTPFRDFMDKSILLSSRELYNAKKRNLQSSTKKSKARNLARIKFLIRACTRPTPYGLFAGAALGEFCENPNIEPMVIDERKAILECRADYSWLSHFIYEMENNPSVYPQLQLRFNNNCYVSGDRLKNPHHSNHGFLMPEETVTERTHMRNTPLITYVKQQAQTFIRYDLLKSRIQSKYPGVPEEKIISTINALMENEVLLSNLRAPANCENGLEYVLKILAPIEGIDRQKETLQKINTLINQMNGELEIDQVNAKTIESVYTLMDGLLSQKNEKDLLAVNKGMVLQQNKLPYQVKEIVEQFVEALTYLQVDVPSRLEKFKRQFQEEYGSNVEVPFCTIIDQNDFNGLSYLEKYQPSQDEKDQKIKQIVDEKILDCLQAQQEEINLSIDNFSSLEISREDRYPESFDINFFVSKEKEHYRLWLAPIGGSGAAGDMFNRFNCVLDADLFHQYKENNRSLVCSDKALITVEIREGSVKGRMSNVNNHRNESQYYIALATNVLKNVNFEFKEGNSYAIVGKNGSGKTTLAKLLMGLYDNYEGNIYVNGIELRSIHKEHYSKRIASLFQDFIKYDATFRENIAYGNLDLMDKDAELRDLSNEFRIGHIIDHSKQNLDTQLGYWFDEGKQISFGEWQKLAIARTFSKDADVIFLDEPNSALDAISDYEISQLYQKLFQDKMGIIIAHKFNNLINQVNNILVIENGRLAESGTHTDLLHQGKIYYEMYQLQNKNSAVL